MAKMLLAPPGLRLFQDSQVMLRYLNYVEARNHSAIRCLPTDVKADYRALCLNHYSAINLHYKDRRLAKPVSALSSGLEASVSEPKDNAISIRNVDIVVESKDDEKMQVRVNLPGKETQIVFDKMLRNLARTAPPVPGFRREKGGKTSKVPRDFLLQILGADRVTSFVVQEIVSTTIADYVDKEKLTVKDNKINTIQTAEELKSAFIPGNEFGFNATLEFEKTTQDSS